MRKKKESLIVFGSHSDDFVIGAGATIAEYAGKGKKVTAIVFSYGERSHLWLKGKVVKKMRSKEALNASKVLGCSYLIFDLKEGKFADGYKKDPSIEKKLLTLIKKEKPTKLFTHSAEDPHPDHRAVHKITLQLYEKLNEKPELYIYSIWNPVSFKTNFPALYVNVSKTFSKKLEALKCFPSQKFQAVYPLITLIFYRAIKSGIKIRKKFAEKFYRIK
jgi:N-acetylglucosamine malate deacetylase 1